jgi:integrase/recombinase XerD
MSPFTQAVEDYIQLRRGLGFKLKDYGDYLHKFVAFLQAQGSSHITTRLALDFATLPESSESCVLGASDGHPA